MSGAVNTPQAFPFPNELVDSKMKGDPILYGLPLAQAIFYNNRHYGPMLFRNNRRLYNTWKNYALGRQGEDQYKPVLGVNPRDSKKTWLKAVRFRIKNYATKRVNIAIAKMFAKDYDVFAEPIDPLSANRKEELKAKVNAYLKDREWFAEFEQRLGKSFSPVNPDLLPENDEELDMMVNMDIKDKVSLALEKAIMQHIEYNEYQKIREQLDFDVFVLGIGILWVRIDSDYRITIERIDPSKFIAPSNNTPNFNDMKYWGYVDEYAIAEVKKLDKRNELNETALTDIYEQYRIDNQGRYYGTDELVDYKDVGKVQIMYFEQLTIDSKVYTRKMDTAGNPQYYEKAQDYYKGDSGMAAFKAKYEGTGRKLIKKDIEILYGGYWVVGSKYIFNYGPVSNQAHHRVDGKFGRKFLSCIPYAPHMYDGEIMSTAEQMIPVLDDLQSYNLKIQAAVATAIPKGAYVDLHALRKAKLKWDGKEMSDQEKLLMYMQNGIIVGDSSDRFKPGANYRPIIELENGIANDVSQYVALIQQGLFELDEIIGINKVTAASTLPERTGAKVAQMQSQGSETALDYLYRADHYLFQETCKRLYPLHLQVLKYGPKGRYSYSLSDADVNLLKKELIHGKKDFAINVNVRPSESEWSDFLLDVEGAYREGMIKLSDKIALKEIRNIRQAREYLKAIERRNERVRNQQELQKIEANNKGNQETLMISQQAEDKKHQQNLAEIDAQSANQMRRDEQLHNFKMEQIREQKGIEGELEEDSDLRKLTGELAAATPAEEALP